MKVMSYKDLSILRQIGVKIRYDGEDVSSVKVPIGNFFGSTFGRYKHYCSRYIGTTSGGYHSFFPMPFKKGFKLLVKNYSKSQTVRFYGHIEYQEMTEFPKDVGYFYCSFERATPKIGKPFKILEVDGRGLYIGTSMGMRGSNINIPLFFLEGNIEVTVDDELHPPGQPCSEELIVSIRIYLHSLPGEPLKVLPGCYYSPSLLCPLP